MTVPRTKRGDLAAVFFDLDGVLIDSETAWDAARRTVVAETGGHWRADATAAMMGMSAAEWSRYLRDELGVPLATAAINEMVVARLLAGYKRELPLLPGAVVAVRRLAARWPLGLASSANRQVIEVVLSASGLAGSFAATVSGDEVARAPTPRGGIEVVSLADISAAHSDRRTRVRSSIARRASGAGSVRDRVGDGAERVRDGATSRGRHV